MPKHILVTLDGSKVAEEALNLAVDLARAKSLGLRLLRVVPLEQEKSKADQYLAGKLSSAEQAGVRVEVKVLLGSTVETILEQCQTSEMLVMARHGYSGLDHLILGSITLKILRRCPVPLLIVEGSNRKLKDIKKIMVPLDGYTQSTDALNTAVTLCETTDATLSLVQVSEATGIDLGLISAEAETQRMLTYLEQQKESIRSSVQIETLCKFGSASRCLLNLIEENEIDLVVMTSHGQGDFNRWVCGSVTENLVRCSTAPVLVLRPQASSHKGV